MRGAAAGSEPSAASPSPPLDRPRPLRGHILDHRIDGLTSLMRRAMRSSTIYRIQKAGMAESNSIHSAASSAAGYFYQARLALAECLKFAYADSGIEVAIEKLDDVSFEKE